MSQYTWQNFETRPQLERDLHMGKVQWIVNQALARHVFQSKFVNTVDIYMKSHASMSYEELLRMADFTAFKVK